jgi:DNA-binding MarR family transcriptional regulator
LAELASVSRATITGLLDTLERDGFVRREPDPADRRQTEVHLTPAGQEFMHDLLPTHFQLINGLMANLTEAERKTLVKLVHKIVERTTPDSPAGEPAPR